MALVKYDNIEGFKQSVLSLIKGKITTVNPNKFSIDIVCKAGIDYSPEILEMLIVFFEKYERCKSMEIWNTTKPKAKFLKSVKFSKWAIVPNPEAQAGEWKDKRVNLAIFIQFEK